MQRKQRQQQQQQQQALAEAEAEQQQQQQALAEASVAQQQPEIEASGAQQQPEIEAPGEQQLIAPSDEHRNSQSEIEPPVTQQQSQIGAVSPPAPVPELKLQASQSPIVQLIQHQQQEKSSPKPAAGLWFSQSLGPQRDKLKQLKQECAVRHLFVRNTVL